MLILHFDGLNFISCTSSQWNKGHFNILVINTKPLKKHMFQTFSLAANRIRPNPTSQSPTPLS